MTKHADSLQETQAKELLRNMLITTVGVESAQLDPLVDLFELVSYKKTMPLSKKVLLPITFTLFLRVL